MRSKTLFISNVPVDIFRLPRLIAYPQFFSLFVRIGEKNPSVVKKIERNNTVNQIQKPFQLLNHSLEDSFSLMKGCHSDMDFVMIIR